MKKILLALVSAAFCLGCINGGNGSARTIDTPDFSDITGIEWRLISVYVNNQDIQFNRDALPEFFKDIYTLNLDGQMLSGTGAPNLYSAPYSISGEGISIMPMRSTLMASLFEPDVLGEYEFFAFMQGAYEWSLSSKNLELRSRTDGREIRLIFGH